MSNIYNISGEDIVLRIDQVLKARKESREELAKAIGKNRQVFTDWKAKDISPTALDLYIMAKHLGTTFDYLLLGDTDHFPTDIALVIAKLQTLSEEERKPIIALIDQQVDYWRNNHK